MNAAVFLDRDGTIIREKEYLRIPTYRGANGLWKKFGEPTIDGWDMFCTDPRAWWEHALERREGSEFGHAIDIAEPNAGHRAVARLQHAGQVSGVITQNVDGLHTAAGSRGVIELHGRLDEVTCLDCSNLTSREELDRRLREANPGFDAHVAAVNPDGDVELPDEAVARFRTVDCGICGTGMLKPDVVFFGETVPAARVAD